ncbi:M60 family metallopeptidase [Pseudomonas fulva]|uniref:M60 family metallopeptidase n=1 Tax=Pseudomonas fulva TaxID=47880 RepID=UPI003462F42E
MSHPTSLNIPLQQGTFTQCTTCASPPLEETLAAKPIITSLSLRVREKVDIRGSASTQGEVEVFSQGTWKGIASVNPDGTFHNADVPPSYLDNPQSARVRVVNGEPSVPVLANNLFVHPRSVWVTPTPTKSADQQAYQWFLQWADYKPTGYKVPANTSGCWVYVEGDDSAVTITIGIQGLAEQYDRSRQTPNMREHRLVRGFNPLPSDPLGGVVHIRNNGTAGCRVILGDALEPIPYYVLHQTPPQDFHDMLARSHSMTEVQLVGDRVAISAYADTYRRFAHADVGEIVRSHQEVLEIQAQACGLDGSSPQHARSEMWIHAVEATSSRTLNAATGYIALPHGSNADNGYMQALLAGQAHTRWATLHEYGHHFQNLVSVISPELRESSANIYAMAVGRVHRNEYSDVFPKRWPPLKAWLARPRHQKNFMESPDTQAIFEQLRKGFGDSFLPEWDKFVRNNPSLSKDLIGFATSLSSVANCNLAEFLADWGVIRENDATWQAVQTLNLPAPAAWLTDQVPYT